MQFENKIGSKNVGSIFAIESTRFTFPVYLLNALKSTQIEPDIHGSDVCIMTT